jgi:hypothetical protein
MVEVICRRIRFEKMWKWLDVRCTTLSADNYLSISKSDTKPNLQP